MLTQRQLCGICNVLHTPGLVDSESSSPASSAATTHDARRRTAQAAAPPAMSTHGGDVRGGDRAAGGGPEGRPGNGGQQPANGSGQPRTFEVAIPITPPQHRLPQNVQRHQQQQQQQMQYTPSPYDQQYRQPPPQQQLHYQQQQQPQHHGHYAQPNQQYQQYPNAGQNQHHHQLQNHNYQQQQQQQPYYTQHGQQRAQAQSPYLQSPHEIQTPRRSHPPASPAPPQTPQQHTPEHSLLLISLAESYFEAAHTIGANAAAARGPDLSMYYKLVSTGLACLESVLLPQKGKAIQARLEAMVRLRYASVLYEETDNMQEAESVLSKGIITASRSNNLLDLHFSMQHLLVRVMFQLNPKAALIQLNTYTKEAEERENPLWMYAFRFLRCNLLTEPSQCTDITASLHCFRSITGIAQRRNDVSVFILSNLMEAMICLHTGPEGVEAAQRAIAKANSMQLEEGSKFTELAFLHLIVDLVCSLMLGRPSVELETKLMKLQSLLSVRETRENWSAVGDFDVPVHPSRQGRIPDLLRFRWFARDDLFIVGYFLSGLARFQSNTQEAQKAEKYLKEGLRRIDLNLEINGPMPYSMPAAESRLEWRKLLRCFMLVYLTFLLSIRTEWDEALKSLQTLNEWMTKLSIRQDHPNLDKLVIYLTGTIYQGTGDLVQALDLYENIMHENSDIGIMATLNMVFILRGSEMRDARRADSLLAGLERTCMESKNTLIKAAFCCVKGTERGELLKSKKFLATALQSAQQLANQQIIFIVLSFMCHRFFSGVVSEQAEKSARAAYVNSKKGKDNMWSFISGQMLQDCLARQGQELDDADVNGINANYYAVVKNLSREPEEEGV